MKRRWKIVLSAILITVGVISVLLVNTAVQEPQLKVTAPQRLSENLYRLEIDAEVPWAFFDLYIETNGKIIYNRPRARRGKNYSSYRGFNKLHVIVDINVTNEPKYTVTVSSLFKSRSESN